MYKPNGLMEHCLIRSYDEAVKYFAKARFPDKGRLIKQWCRMYRDERGFVIGIHNSALRLFLIRPDNTIEITATPQELRTYGTTLTSSLHRALPLYMNRLGKGRYAVEHLQTLDSLSDNDYYPYEYVSKVAPEVFAGIKFDLATGKCLNPAPRFKDTIIASRRAEWVRALRTFKRGVKARAKVGVVQTLCNDVVAARAGSKTWQKPDWTSEYWIGMLFTSIEQNTYPTELLRGFVQTCDVSYWLKEPPTPVSTIAAVDKVMNDLSIELRRRFGVFGDANL